MNPHEKSRLGRTQVQVDRLGLGTAPLGGWPHALTEAECVDTITAVWDAGVRHFDTAPYYGFGNAESRLSKVLADKPRDSYTISTKVGRLLVDGASENPAYLGAPPLTPVFDFSYDAVFESLAGSRRRLGIDRFDIVLVHDPDDHHEEALAGSFRALSELRAAGEIGAIGFAMNDSQALNQFALESDADCFLMAGRYTLLEQGPLDDLLPTALAKGMSVIAGGVYNSGILADPRASAMYNYEPAGAELIQKALRIEEICIDNGVSLRAAAQQFTLAHPAIASIVVGALSPAEARENVELSGHDIPAALWQDLRGAGLLREDAPLPGV
jgi:D-threo-aldose 1-dehydrogenase